MSNKAIVQASFDDWRAGTGSPFDLLAEDATWTIVGRSVASKTYGSDAHGTARDGKPYANTYAWFLDMREGKIVKAFAFFDSVEFNDLWQRVSPASS